MAFSARARTASREGSSKATTQRPYVEKGAAGHTWERAFHTEQQYKAHSKKMVRLAQGYQKGRFRTTGVQAGNQWRRQKTEVFFMASEFTAKHHGYSDRGFECLPRQYRYGPLGSCGNSQTKHDQVYSTRVYWWKRPKCTVPCTLHELKVVKEEDARWRLHFQLVSAMYSQKNRKPEET